MNDFERSSTGNGNVFLSWLEAGPPSDFIRTSESDDLARDFLDRYWLNIDIVDSKGAGLVPSMARYPHVSYQELIASLMGLARSYGLVFDYVNEGGVGLKLHESSMR